MATSAIGPGFITQTTKFTDQLQAAFGFVILISLLLDIGVQLNIWRIIGVTKLYAPDIANKVFPGAGMLLTVLITIGSLAFNIANVAGAGLGLHVLTGCSVTAGAIISCAIAMFIFWVKEAGKAMDRFAKILGFIMIGLTLYIAFQSHPPLADALQQTILPKQINETIILTVVGGTVGGYISFSGIHRLLDAGISGEPALPKISSSSVTGIIIASVMRCILFLAALGVVSHHVQLDASNPAATIFQTVAGNWGYRLFGLIFWSAAITSVVGSAFTTVSFLKTVNTYAAQNSKWYIIGFILLSTIIFIVVGKPVSLLVFGGAVNGLILPVALSIILLAAYKKNITTTYRHPLWMSIAGWLVVLAMTWMSIKAVIDFMKQF
ncbi:MAG: divalent metal cation transporter [Bacteroidetes bacterium]|nr:divalent metal cation transporter [Bacteroidota bacterium]